ncbi:MAG: hypothetical protein ACMV1C_03460 [Bacteroides graminisolvens]|jgi:hypothetical protein|uniref:Uncharacterized protein n=1 Tax=bioreactor metagenome TaxID=1076179 RepID=A0A644XR94_9ZZZZ|nr:hypothetical protein [Bacteroides graminisolvens]MBP6062076.1 hypothetical protein [Bacteroides sp.]MBP6248337.1 hypothetical protein [Bacteroides sp.]MBP6980509.1 hypothetical protein [Bacteroides sp.]MBP9495515.1 hypothetical protein [Bacteroides sp.]MDD3210937.1 hypothetical protein [Bacteroides graminisolvens]
MEDKVLTEKESLDLISQMIRNTRSRLEDNSGIPFLIWGYTTVIVAVIVWSLVTTSGNYLWHWLWFAIPVFGGTLWLLHNKKQLNNRSRVITFVDRAISHVWMVFGIASFMISIISFLTYIPILFIVLLTMGMATAITGLIIRFKPIIFSGFIGILFSPLCVIVRDTSSILIFAAIFVLMMVIPGHMLNYTAKRR